MMGESVMAISGSLIGFGSFLLWRQNALSEYLKKQMKEKNKEVSQYQLIRRAVCALLMTIGLLLHNGVYVIVAVVGYGITIPKERLYHSPVKMPYYYVRKTIQKAEGRKKNQELLEVLSYIRNMTIQLETSPASSVYLIEQLLAYVKKTKPAFQKMLNQIRVGNHLKAEHVFVLEIGTTLAEKCARILLQLDEIHPKNFLEYLQSAQQEIWEESITQKQIRDERLSDLAMIPVLATMILLFVNFIYVAYFFDLSLFL